MIDGKVESINVIKDDLNVMGVNKNMTFSELQSVKIQVSKVQHLYYV